MAMSRDAELRSQAQEFNEQGKALGAKKEWTQAMTQFLQAINTLNQIHSNNITDDDFRLKAKFHHNVGLSYYNNYSIKYVEADRIAAMEYLQKAANAIAFINDPTDKDEESMAKYHGLLYLCADPLLKPVDDAFEEYTKRLMLEVEAAKGKDYTNEQRRQLVRYNLTLAGSMFEDNQTQRLETAISMSLSIDKRFDLDERLLTACYLKQAEMCEEDGLMKDAADACRKAAACMNQLKAPDADDAEKMDDIKNKLEKFGVSPQNSKKASSALVQHSGWIKLEAHTSRGDEVIHIPTSLLNQGEEIPCPPPSPKKP